MLALRSGVSNGHAYASIHKKLFRKMEMTFAFLPHEGEIWICHADGPRVTPLAPAPGERHALRKWATNGGEFGFLDQAGKRLGYYRLLDQAPWYETVMPPVTLPPACVAKDFLIHDGQVIAGGHSNKGEAIWTRTPGRDKVWRSISLPDVVRKRGKSIDAVFVRDDKLIAFDNILMPKWILVYELLPALSEAGVELVRLRTHTTYEQIAHAAEGQDVYALYSSGVNHGIRSYYVSLIGKKSLAEIAVWSGHLEKSTLELINEVQLDAILGDDIELDLDLEIPLQKQIDGVLKLWSRNVARSRGNIGEMLSSIHDMAFCGDHLFLAVGTQGLKVGHTGFLSERSRDRKEVSKPGFCSVPLKLLTTVTQVQVLPNVKAGMYAIGKDAVGLLTFEWVGAEQFDFSVKV